MSASPLPQLDGTPEAAVARLAAWAADGNDESIQVALDEAVREVAELRLLLPDMRNAETRGEMKVALDRLDAHLRAAGAAVQ